MAYCSQLLFSQLSKRYNSLRPLLLPKAAVTARGLPSRLPQGAAVQLLGKGQESQHMQKARSPQISSNILSSAPMNRYCHFHSYRVRIQTLLSWTYVWAQSFQRYEIQVYFLWPFSAPLAKYDLSKPSLFCNSPCLPEIHPRWCFFQLA